MTAGARVGLSCWLSVLTCLSVQAQRGVVGDLNGDGKVDLVAQVDDGSGRHWIGRLSQGTAFAPSADWTFTSTPGVEIIAMADVNGDGKDDLVLQYDLGATRCWQARLSTGSAFSYNGDWTSTTTPNVTPVGMADVNGDGKDDLVLQYDLGYTRCWQARLSTGSGFVSYGDWTSTTTPNVTPVGLADVNNDGKADLVLQYDNNGLRNWQARLSTGSSFAWSGDWTSTGSPNVTPAGLADVNGDRKADLILQYDYNGTRNWQARLSSGSAFVSSGDWTSTGSPNVTPIGLVDANGDGKADLILQYDYNGTRNWQARLSSGSAFVSSGDWASTGSPNVTPIGLADVNGDGKADLVLQYAVSDGLRWQARLSSGAAYISSGDWASYPDKPGYNLAWSDEFIEPAINTNYWNLEVNGNGGGNNEWQYYTDRTTGPNANAYIENGKLVIAARCETYGGKSYTSARLNSLQKIAVKYGMIEARIKAPSNAQGVWDAGTWPAFWMMGTRSAYWPFCGEIDIFEMNGKRPTNLVGGVFWDDYLPPASKASNYSKFYAVPWTANSDYHIYSIIWDAQRIYWYVDGVLRFDFDHQGLANWPIPAQCQQTFMNPFYMIFNMAVGGKWDQVGVPNPANYPQFMYVDWVRVWTKL